MPFLESPLFGMRLKWNMLKMECFLFGTSSFWNMPFFEYAQNGMWSKWNVIKMECHKLMMNHNYP